MKTLQDIDGKSESEIKKNAERIDKVVAELMQVWESALNKRRKQTFMAYLVKEISKLIS